MTPPLRSSVSRPLPSSAADAGLADEERARHLSFEWGVPYVDLGQVPISPDALQRVPERVLLRHRVLPLGLHHGRLRLAMANPLDIEAIHETRLVTGFDIEPVVASETALLERLQACLALPLRGGRPAAPPEGHDAPPGAEREAYRLGPSSPADVLAALLDTARGRGASRVLLVPQADGLAVRLHLRGVVRAEPTVPLPVADAVVEHIGRLADLGATPGRGPRQGRFAHGDGDCATEVRVATYPTVLGDALVLRLCPGDHRLVDGLDGLGLPADTRTQLERLLGCDTGLLLVAGPPGSGRSTTLYAAVEHVTAAGRAVFTVEEFIERPLPGAAQAELDEARGLTYQAALRALRRIEPDVVLVGEIQTPSVAALAVQLARAGTLVLGGVLGDDAASVAGHLAGAELDASLLAGSLLGVVAQRTVRTLCAQCREAYMASARTLEPLSPSGTGDTQVTLYRAVGCAACGGQGYAGQTGVFELMVLDERLRALLEARSPHEAIRQAAVRCGMTPLARHALARVLAGETSVDEVHPLLRDA